MYTSYKLDKMRNFRFGMVAIDLIEQQFGDSLMNIDLDNLTMRQTATIIWAGLVHEDAELTVDKVMNLIDDHSSIMQAIQIMTEAIQKTFNGTEEPKN